MDDDTVRDDQYGLVQLHETPEEIAFEVRGDEGALWTGSRLLIGIWTFAFAALAFAYFYLRSANNEDLWRPNGITAPTTVGAAIFALTVACALLAIFGERRFRAGQALDWEVAGWTGVFGALLVVGLQIWQLTACLWRSPARRPPPPLLFFFVRRLSLALPPPQPNAGGPGPPPARPRA